MRHEAASAFVAGVCACDHQAPGLHVEAAGDRIGPKRLLFVVPRAAAAVVGMETDLDAWLGAGLLDGQRAPAGVGRISIEPHEARQLVASLREEARGRFAVSRSGRVGGHGPQQTHGVDNDATLAALDLLARVEPV